MKLPSSEVTGTTFCIPPVPLLVTVFFTAVFFTTVVDAAPPDAAAFFVAPFAAAAISILPANAPKTLVGAMIAMRNEFFSFKMLKP